VSTDPNASNVQPEGLHEDLDEDIHEGLDDEDLHEHIDGGTTEPPGDIRIAKAMGALHNALQMVSPRALCEALWQYDPARAQSLMYNLTEVNPEQVTQRQRWKDYWDGRVTTVALDLYRYPRDTEGHNRLHNRLAACKELRDSTPPPPEHPAWDLVGLVTTNE